MTLLCCDTVVLWHCCVVTLLCCDCCVVTLLCCDTCVVTAVLWHCCVVTLLCCDTVVLWLLCCDTVVLWHCCVVTLLCCDTVVLWLLCCVVTLLSQMSDIFQCMLERTDGITNRWYNELGSRTNYVRPIIPHCICMYMKAWQRSRYWTQDRRSSGQRGHLKVTLTATDLNDHTRYLSKAAMSTRGARRQDGRSVCKLHSDLDLTLVTKGI